MRVNPLCSKKPTGQAVPEKSKEQSRDKYDVQPGRAIDCVISPGPLPQDVAADDRRGYEKTAQHEEHDDCLVAEPGEKIEGIERQGFVLQVLEVHKKKRSQVAKHYRKSRTRADQIEGIGSCDR